MKNFWAFFIFGIKNKQIDIFAVIIGIILTLLALIEVKTKNTTPIPFLVLTFTIINIGYHLWCLWKDLSYLRQTNNRIKEQEEPTNFKLHETTKKDYPDRQNYYGHSVIYSSKFNSLLRSDTSIKYRESDDKRKKVKKYIKRYRKQLFPFLNCKYHAVKNNKGNFYNEKKLCMDSEFSASGESYTVSVSKGEYYETCLTNFIYTQKLSHQSGFFLEPPFNIHNYPIQTLDKSVMSDHIGVSTLAITCDGYVIFLKQNEKALFNMNCLVPSGSGSVDYDDLEKEQDFRETIINAAERELNQETKIQIEKSKEKKATEIIGFYRDLKRGGKPEFCCITWLNHCIHELSVKPEKNELFDIYEYFKIFEDNGNLKDFSELTNFFSDQKYSDSQISLSLHMNLFMLYNSQIKQKNIMQKN